MDNINSIIERIFNNTYKKDNNYIYFGSFPQHIKTDDVEIIDTIKYNNKDYYLGSDNEIYVKEKAKPLCDFYSFTNGTNVVKDDDYYFKVEPVKWKLLLFTDKILVPHRYDLSLSNYETSEIKKYLNEELINEIFTKNQNRLISDEGLGKLFLLSLEEITNPKYGFNEDEEFLDKARFVKVTDFAIAKGVYCDRSTKYQRNGWFWLRTPWDENFSRHVYSNGSVDHYYHVSGNDDGVAFAIILDLE